MRICKLCGHEFKDYQGKMRTRCGSCNTKIRRYRTKLAAIKLLGGKCADCGWQGNQAAFQFHHINHGKKEFNIGNVANKKWEFIKKELKKCVLLCANCHSIRHSSKNDDMFIKEAQNYKGKKFSL
jgi:hypothetical protein